MGVRVYRILGLVLTVKNEGLRRSTKYYERCSAILLVKYPRGTKGEPLGRCIGRIIKLTYSTATQHYTRQPPRPNPLNGRD